MPAWELPCAQKYAVSSCPQLTGLTSLQVLIFQHSLSGSLHAFPRVVGRIPAMPARLGQEHEERERTKTVSMDSAIVAITCASLLYAVSWVMGCSAAPTSRTGGGGKKINHSADLVHASQEDKLGPVISGRKLTVEKMAQRSAASLQYSNEEYGVAFDAPKGYVLREGELPEMDRGLGYLGPIPMHFPVPGGVGLPTVERPEGRNPGT